MTCRHRNPAAARRSTVKQMHPRYGCADERTAPSRGAIRQTRQGETSLSFFLPEAMSCSRDEDIFECGLGKVHGMNQVWEGVDDLTDKRMPCLFLNPQRAVEGGRCDPELFPDLGGQALRILCRDGDH